MDTESDAESDTEIRAGKSLVELVKHVFDSSSCPRDGIAYGDLAGRIDFLDKNGKAHGHGMGPVLGEMRSWLDELSKEWGEHIPHIQSLVGRKDDPLRLPSDGIGEVWPKYAKLTERKKINKVYKEYDKIVEFGSRWNDVLSYYELSPAQYSKQQRVLKEHKKGSKYGGGGESPEHNDLKIFVSKNPELVEANKSDKSVTEYLFPSQDAVDVLFKNKKRWVAVEVKSRISSPKDYERGLYQCVKYYALLEAMKKESKYKVPKEIQVVLLLEKTLPKKYKQVAKKLKIEVIENIKPTGKKV